MKAGNPHFPGFFLFGGTNNFSSHLWSWICVFYKYFSLLKPTKQLKTLSYIEKAFEEVEKGRKKKCEIAKESLHKKTFNNLKIYDKVLGHFDKIASDIGKNRKRVRCPDNPGLDQCVLKWFKQVSVKNIPLSGTMVRTKA